MATVKSMLRLLLPSRSTSVEIHCFLDVDNLTSLAELEGYVRRSDLVRLQPTEMSVVPSRQCAIPP